MVRHGGGRNGEAWGGGRMRHSAGPKQMAGLIRL